MSRDEWFARQPSDMHGRYKDTGAADEPRPICRDCGVSISESWHGTPHGWSCDFHWRIRQAHGWEFDARTVAVLQRKAG